MAYTLGEAARATGMSKATIHDALNKGKISGTKNEHGHWQIEPAELHRVYPPANASTNGAEPPSERILNPLMMVVEAERDGLKAQLEQMQRERDELSRRLDQEADDRRAMTRALTDQRERRSWFDVFFRRKER